MLVFVPLLAGIWPAVRAIFNRYNQAVTDARLALDAAAERLQFVTSTLGQQADGSAQIVRIIEDLNTKIDLIVADYSLKAIENIALPSVWALAFLASLCVTLAHLLYQARAPELIRQTKLGEFVNDELKRFAEYESDGQLRAARDFLMHYKSQVHFGPEEQEIERTISEAGEKKGKAAIIEKAARTEYFLAARQKPMSAIACGFLYLIGLILIAWITITQTINVLSAAGFWAWPLPA